VFTTLAAPTAGTGVQLRAASGPAHRADLPPAPDVGALVAALLLKSAADHIGPLYERPAPPKVLEHRTGPWQSQYTPCCAGRPGYRPNTSPYAEWQAQRCWHRPACRSNVQQHIATMAR